LQPVCLAELANKALLVAEHLDVASRVRSSTATCRYLPADPPVVVVPLPRRRTRLPGSLYMPSFFTSTWRSSPAWRWQ
jgi:hypothetical protein